MEHINLDYFSLSYYNRRNTGRPKTIEDDKHQPYKCGYLDCGTLPLFFFGQGLSYSNFVYKSMTLDKTEITETDVINVKVTIKNSVLLVRKLLWNLVLNDFDMFYLGLKMSVLKNNISKLFKNISRSKQ